MIDWSKIQCCRPSDQQLLKLSKGLPIYGQTPAAYEHMNWAFRRAGTNKVACVALFPTCEDFTVLVEQAQEVVRDEGIVESNQTEVDRKKWWQFK